MDRRVIGHRGARGLFPENTQEGIEAAAALGVGCFEIDVGATRDGIAVVHHDPALNPDIARRADGGWVAAAERPALRHLTAAELRGWDVGTLRPGSPTRAAFPAQQDRPGARIPVLAELLARGTERQWLVEIKTHPDRPGQTPPPDELAMLTLAAADQAGATGRCTFIGFEWDALRALRRSRPGLRLAWSTRPATLERAETWLGCGGPVAVEDLPAMIADEGGSGWVPDEASLSPALVEAAHRRGVQVLPWTVNDPGRMRTLLDYGVDGIITDYPDRLLAVLAGIDPQAGSAAAPR